MGNKKKFNASENVQQWSVKSYLWATNNIIATQNSSGSTSTWDWKEADRAFTNVCVCVWMFDLGEEIRYDRQDWKEAKREY